jgi:4-amino-4-deoxy-L-arabinose transferase-like glycosyltransferase
LQILIDLVMCWLVYRIGRKMFNERAGILASLIYACFIPGIELVVRPHRDIWVTFLFIFTVYQLIALRDSRKPWLQILSIGIATGIVAWMRSTVLLYVIFMVPLLFIVRPGREALRFSAVLLAAFTLTFSPLIIRNYVAFDRFMATRGVFWHSFWAGVGQMPNPYNLQDDDETIVRFAQSLDSTAARQTIAYEQVLKAEAYKFVRAHPVWYTTSIVRRAIVFVAPKVGREIFFQPLLPKHVSGTLNLSVSKIALLVVDVLLTCLFLTGIWLTRSRWKDLLVVGYPYLYTLATLAPFYLVGRNIMNVYFVVLIVASVALTSLWDHFRPAA